MERFLDLLEKIDASRYGFRFHKGWKRLIRDDLDLSLKVSIDVDTLRIEPVVSTGSEDIEKTFICKIDLLTARSVENFLRTCVGLPTLEETAPCLSLLARKLESLDAIEAIADRLNITLGDAIPQKRDWVYKQINLLDPINQKALDKKTNAQLINQLGDISEIENTPQQPVSDQTLYDLLEINWSDLGVGTDDEDLIKAAIIRELQNRHPAGTETEEDDRTVGDHPSFEAHKAELEAIGISEETPIADAAIQIGDRIREPDYTGNLGTLAIELEDDLMLDEPPPKPAKGFKYGRQVITRSLLAEHPDQIESIGVIDPVQKTPKPKQTQTQLELF